MRFGSYEKSAHRLFQQQRQDGTHGGLHRRGHPHRRAAGRRQEDSRYQGPCHRQGVPVKKFLDAVIGAGAAGKLAGAFGSYSHDVGYSHEDYAPSQVLDYLDKQGKLTPFDLGAFHLQEDAVETDDGMKSCHDYGRVFGEKLGD